MPTLGLTFMNEGVVRDGRRDLPVRPDWTGTYASLSAADRTAPLEPGDLERLGIAAFLIGRDGESLEILARAHHAFLRRGLLPRAVRCAFWLGFEMQQMGDLAQAAGWFGRGRRLLDDSSHDCVERGYLLLPLASRRLADGEAANARALYIQAGETGERFSDPDLIGLARQGRGRALIMLGQESEGLSLLDEVMVSITAGDLSPIVAGCIYCSVIASCFERFDVPRALEWTDALNRWCADQPDLVPYRGECLVYRAALLRHQGAWADAMREMDRACERLAPSPAKLAAGAAYYERGELYRLRGEVKKAEDAYRLASDYGRMPQPGLALLRLAQGRIGIAKSAIARVLDEDRDPRRRTRTLIAAVEILLASHDRAAARAAAEELSAMARMQKTPYLRAASGQAMGAVLLAEGDARDALALLRAACTIWRTLQTPYEAARVHVLMGIACRTLEDLDGGLLELDAARRIFQELGAAPDLAHVERLCGLSASENDAGLTARELTVLRLVASGKTNRTIAGDLAISEKTVARHVSNIFTKLDLSTRSAATAYAFLHRLIGDVPLPVAAPRSPAGSTNRVLRPAWTRD